MKHTISIPKNVSMRVKSITVDVSDRKTPNGAPDPLGLVEVETTLVAEIDYHDGSEIVETTFTSLNKFLAGAGATNDNVKSGIGNQITNTLRQFRNAYIETILSIIDTEMLHGKWQFELDPINNPTYVETHK